MYETPDYLAELNEEQRAAVLHDGMPFSILAGAGKPRTSSDGRWRVGDRLFNHDRGYNAS
jgi:hypothetical protein